MNLKYINYIFIFSLFLIFIAGCSKHVGNPVLNYLKNSDLKFDNKVQRDNIMQASRDVIMLSPEDLKKMRYKDYDGNENTWDLQTLFTKHFVPRKPGLSWGNNFYSDIKADSVQAIISKILITY